MIRLDITTFIFFYTLFSVIIILLAWVTSGYRGVKGFSPRDVDYIWKCTVCAHVYVNSRHEDISKCPLCGSYNKRRDTVPKKSKGVQV